jgi:hypothetical protein
MANSSNAIVNAIAFDASTREPGNANRLIDRRQRLVAGFDRHP